MNHGNDEVGAVETLKKYSDKTLLFALTMFMTILGPSLLYSNQRYASDDGLLVTRSYLTMFDNEKAALAQPTIVGLLRHTCGGAKRLNACTWLSPRLRTLLFPWPNATHKLALLCAKA